MSVVSSALLKATDSLLLVIDIQEKFRPSHPSLEGVIQQGRILIQAANHLKIPVLVSEQYPQGLGPTVLDLKQVLPSDQIYFSKLSFSALGCESLANALRTLGRRQVVVFGVEAHVCVMQTCLELMAEEYQVLVVADAVSSRKQHDRDLALQRIAKYGADLVSTEMVLFEWLRVSGTPEFKELQKLVR